MNEIGLSYIVALLQDNEVGEGGERDCSTIAKTPLRPWTENERLRNQA